MPGARNRPHQVRKNILTLRLSERRVKSVGDVGQCGGQWSARTAPEGGHVSSTGPGGGESKSQEEEEVSLGRAQRHWTRSPRGVAQTKEASPEARKEYP